MVLCAAAGGERMEVIAVDQDKLGQQGVRVKQDGELEIWKKALVDGSAVGLLNRGAVAARMTVRWDVGVGEKRRVRDLWGHVDVEAGEYSVGGDAAGVVNLGKPSDGTSAGAAG